PPECYTPSLHDLSRSRRRRPLLTLQAGGGDAADEVLLHQEEDHDDREGRQHARGHDDLPVHRAAPGPELVVERTLRPIGIVYRLDRKSTRMNYSHGSI